MLKEIAKSMGHNIFYEPSIITTMKLYLRRTLVLK